MIIICTFFVIMVNVCTFTIVKSKVLNVFRNGRYAKTGCMQDIAKLLAQVKEELKAHQISYHDISVKSATERLNGGGGYSEMVINNMLAGKSTVRVDLLNVITALIESKMDGLRALANANPEPFMEKIDALQRDRIQLETTLTGVQTSAA